MSIPRMLHRAARLRRGLAASAASLILAACADQLPTRPLAPADGAASTTRLECTVTVAAGEMRCGAPAGAPRKLLLGGQGTYLRVVSSGTHYDGSAVFESSVAVQNLLDQAMGSADGTAVFGMNVLFASGPTVTSGNGTVEVANADGEGTFTASGQPYFHYHEIVAPRGTSQAKLWRFNVPSTVATFAFTLLVETRLQAEQGILRWERKAGNAGGFFGLYDAWGTAPKNVYAVGLLGTIMHYDGSTWAVIQSPVRLNLYAVHGTDARAIYAVGEKGVMVRSDGNHWSVLKDSVVGRTLGDVAAPTADSVFAVGYQHDAAANHDAGLLMRSTNGGASWVETLTADSLNTYLSAVWAVSSTEVYAAGYRYNRARAHYEGVIMHSLNAGASWSTTLSPHTTDRSLFSLWADGPNSVYVAGYQVDSAGGYQPLVLHSTDGGGSWKPSTGPAGSDGVIQSIWGTPDGALFAFGEQDDLTTSLVLRSTDGGTTWTEVLGGTEYPVYSGWGSSATDVYAVGDELLVHYDGSAWTHPEPVGDAGGSFEAAWTPGGTVAFAAGWRLNVARGWDEGLISRSTDGGATWTPTTFPGTTGVRLYGIWGTSPNDLVAVGDDAGDGIIVRSTNGGQSWVNVPPPTADARQLFTVWGASASDLWAAGLQTNLATGKYEALLLHSTNGGATWTLTTHASPVLHNRAISSIWGSSATDLYAVGWDYENATNTLRGLIMHSADGGANWSSTVTDLTVASRLTGVWAGPGAGAYATGDRPIPGSTRKEGVVLYSGDDGATWSVVKSTQGGRSGFGYTAVWGAGPGHVYAVGSFGTITRFDGTAWLETASGSRDDLTGIHGTSGTSAYVVGLNGTALHGTR